jgi:hypothetical protein
MVHGLNMSMILSPRHIPSTPLTHDQLRRLKEPAFLIHSPQAHHTIFLSPSLSILHTCGQFKRLERFRHLIRGRGITPVIVLEGEVNLGHLRPWRMPEGEGVEVGVEVELEERTLL